MTILYRVLLYNIHNIITQSIYIYQTLETKTIFLHINKIKLDHVFLVVISVRKLINIFINILQILHTPILVFVFCIHLYYSTPINLCTSLHIAHYTYIYNVYTYIYNVQYYLCIILHIFIYMARIKKMTDVLDCSKLQVFNTNPLQSRGL